ncbi:phospholipid carrier-dependent glycosyltransferase [Streptomyces sp. IBSNAI002]
MLNVLFRLSLVTRQHYPTVCPDEQMYLVIARIMAGRPTTEMPGNQIIPGGYSLLISPALRMTQEPVHAYHLIMGINALISCLVLPVAYWALRRLGVSVLVSYAAALAAVMLPPVLFYSQYAMADTPLPVLVLLWLIGVHGLFSQGSRRRRTWFGLLAGFAAGYCLLTHDRGGVVIALTVVVLLAALVFNWAPRIASTLALGMVAVMFAVKHVMTAWLLSRIDGAHPSAVGNAVFETLADTRLMRRTIMRSIGHLWYFMTSTWGMGALALVVCLYVVFGKRFGLADRVTAFLMVALLAGITLAAAAGLPADGRIDTITYARYLSPLAAVYLLVAIAALYHVRGRKRIAALGAAACGVTLLLTVVLVHLAGKEFRKSYFVIWALPDSTFLSSLWPANGDWGSFHAGRTTVIALAVLAAVLLLRLLGGDRRVALATGAIGVSLAVFAGVAGVAITDHVTKPWSDWRRGYTTGFVQEAGIRPGDRLVMDDGFQWETRTSMAFMVLDGQVWTRALNKNAPAPAEANVAALPLSDENAPAGDSWPDAPSGWHVDRDVRKSHYVIWRRGE